MARELDVKVVVDDEEALQKLQRVDDTIEGIPAKANPATTAVDGLVRSLGQLADKQRNVSEESRGLARNVEQSTQGWASYTVSAAQADKVLSDLFVANQRLPSVLTTVRGNLNDVATEVGLTVNGLGLLNAAGLAIGAGIAGWGIGRVIADFTGLDDKIARGTASLFGYSVSEQEAGAKADVLARASATAGREITNFDEAVTINTRHLEEWKIQANEMADAAHRMNAVADSTHLVREWNAELEKVRSAGVIRQLTADIDSNLFSMNQLADRYRISAGAISFYKNELKAAADDQRGFDNYLKEREHAMAEALAKEEKAQRALADAKREVLLVTTRIQTEYDKEIAQHEKLILQLQTEASLAEFAARTANNKPYGVDAQGAPLEMQNNPFIKAQNAADSLATASSNPRLRGISTTEREAQINNDFLKSIAEGTSVVVGKTAAERDATDSATRLAKSHAGAVQASDNLMGIFGQFTQVIAGTVPTVNLQTGQNTQNTDPRILAYLSMGYTQGEAMSIVGGSGGMIGAPKRRASGGPVDAGEPYWVGDGGEPELFTPGRSGSITPASAMGGSVTIGDIHIHGDIDSELRARQVADMTAAKVLKRVKTQSRIPYGKT